MTWTEEQRVGLGVAHRDVGAVDLAEGDAVAGDRARPGDHVGGHVECGDPCKHVRQATGDAAHTAADLDAVAAQLAGVVGPVPDEVLPVRGSGGVEVLLGPALALVGPGEDVVEQIGPLGDRPPFLDRGVWLRYCAHHTGIWWI
jgi:hypothetical protein